VGRGGFGSFARLSPGKAERMVEAQKRTRAAKATSAGEIRFISCLSGSKPVFYAAKLL
jgi:hypothetical protein